MAEILAGVAPPAVRIKEEEDDLLDLALVEGVLDVDEDSEEEMTVERAALLDAYADADERDDGKEHSAFYSSSSGASDSESKRDETTRAIDIASLSVDANGASTGDSSPRCRNSPTDSEGGEEEEGAEDGDDKDDKDDDKEEESGEEHEDQKEEEEGTEDGDDKDDNKEEENEEKHADQRGEEEDEDDGSQYNTPREMSEEPVARDEESDGEDVESKMAGYSTPRRGSDGSAVGLPAAAAAAASAAAAAAAPEWSLELVVDSGAAAEGAEEAVAAVAAEFAAAVAAELHDPARLVYSRTAILELRNEPPGDISRFHLFRDEAHLRMLHPSNAPSKWNKKKFIKYEDQPKCKKPIPRRSEPAQDSSWSVSAPAEQPQKAYATTRQINDFHSYKGAFVKSRANEQSSQETSAERGEESGGGLCSDRVEQQQQYRNERVSDDRHYDERRGEDDRCSQRSRHSSENRQNDHYRGPAKYRHETDRPGRDDARYSERRRSSHLADDRQEPRRCERSDTRGSSECGQYRQNAADRPESVVRPRDEARYSERRRSSRMSDDQPEARSRRYERKDTSDADRPGNVQPRDDARYSECGRSSHLTKEEQEARPRRHERRRCDEQQQQEQPSTSGRTTEHGRKSERAGSETNESVSTLQAAPPPKNWAEAFKSIPYLPAWRLDADESKLLARLKSTLTGEPWMPHHTAEHGAELPPQPARPTPTPSWAPGQPVQLYYHLEEAGVNCMIPLDNDEQAEDLVRCGRALSTTHFAFGPEFPLWTLRTLLEAETESEVNPFATLLDSMRKENEIRVSRRIWQAKHEELLALLEEKLRSRLR